MKKCNKEQLEQFEQCKLELDLELDLESDLELDLELDLDYNNEECNMYDLVEEWFTPSESDSITAKHLKALALELAICIVDEVKDDFKRLKSLYKLVDIIEECSSYEG